MSVDPARKPRNETEHERLDRQLMELLQGFRVATTGVQVLFAFLLTVPFSANFDTKVSDTGRALFYVSLFGAGLASVCFIAPVIQHRILFRLGQKALLIRRANRFGIAGAFALGISMTAATTLVVQALSDEAAAAVATAVVAVLLCGWAWFVQPYLTRRRAEEHPPETEGS
ncbi:DUF6328 family protein [Actinomadura citrea]|jgi:hypothetical protein|uniref:Uncharacterized protein n=1 Tax=Actinomadura citrea TaxID=46158 RepID=A0A7Y9G6V9_9ACTN|nr:DUF6328 family protein [Actinomadura citrea]NYE11089.1 hypothetical protein [Actinomadura citrea]GGU06962.1 hypothetical protein GCM10010177_77850 [Actinomadura citrea]